MLVVMGGLDYESLETECYYSIYFCVNQHNILININILSCRHLCEKTI